MSKLEDDDLKAQVISTVTVNLSKEAGWYVVMENCPMVNGFIASGSKRLLVPKAVLSRRHKVQTKSSYFILKLNFLFNFVVRCI